MFAPDQYKLLDFGAGRKLERVGGFVLDRPSPAAEGIAPSAPELWSAADARFVRASDAGLAEEGAWMSTVPLPPSWTVRHDALTLELRPTPFGHVGLFAEQAENWDWLTRHARGAKTLNLFAYTGGSTVAAAAAGAEVTHVDAARSVVAWGRRNAELSELQAAPIRWLVDDARKFVARELRRGNRYDAVILDPPSYGHGARGEPWKVGRHLAPLLSDCARLTAGRRAFFLLTCHSPGYGPAELAALLVQAGVAPSPRELEARALTLTTAGGRSLPSGALARWPRSP